MSYQHQHHAPGYNSSGNLQLLDPGLVNANRAYGNPPRGVPARTAVVTLWKERVVAVILGAITFTLGALVLAAAFNRGPLHSVFIPVENMTGSIVNTSNIGAVIAGAATLISCFGRFVSTGISRTWLRRKAAKSLGASINQWRTMASGGSIGDARKTPFLAGGMIMLFAIAMGINGAALAGAGIPAPILRLHESAHGPSIPFAGNGGIGSLVNCIDPAEPTQCASMMGVSDLSTAFAQGTVTGGKAAWYFVAGHEIYAPDLYLAALPPPSANTSQYDSPTGRYARHTLVVPMSYYEVTCSALVADASASGQEFSYRSPCFENERIYFGNTARDSETHMTAASCYFLSDPNTTYVEIALASPVTAILASGPVVYACAVTGAEGLGDATSAYGDRISLEPIRLQDYVPLTAADMNSTVTAFIAAVSAEGGLNGKAGPLGTFVASVLTDPNASEVLAVSLSNAMAASASYGYLSLSRQDPALFTSSWEALPTSWSYRGFGWTRSARSLGWSSVCLFIAMVWFLAALYMTGGGTRYDPTDWYHTINTAAGSDIVQLPGTCTTAGLNVGTVKSNTLWYGVVKPGHVGFAQQPTANLLPKETYGYSTSVV